MSAIALYAKPSPRFDDKLKQTELLLKSAKLEIGRLTQASSLGAEDMVITHLLHTLAIEAPTFVLDTGKLHPQTLELLARLEDRYKRTVVVFTPDPPTALAFEASHGAEAMYRSVDLRKTCCDIRKMEPLSRALEGYDGWITGLRQEQSGARSEVQFVESEAGTSRKKINPLALWTWGDVWHYIAQHKVPYNPLHDQFFPSIGCAPCTRAVTLGEDPRSGRWWWEQEGAKECGLHVSGHAASIIPIKATA